MALGFVSGSSEYVDCGTGIINAMANNAAFTVMGWARATSTNRCYIGCMHRSSSNVFANWETYLIANGRIYGYVANAGSGAGNGTTAVVGATTTIDNGAWHHCCYTYIPSTSLTAYLNGAQDAQNTTSIPASFNRNTSLTFRMQRQTSDFPSGGTVFYWTGDLHDVRIYTRALSLAEIQSIYHARGGDTVVSSLLGRWPLLEPDASSASGAGTVTDIAGNGYHGTPYNTPTYASAPFKCRRG
jgi:hypothetical protein